MSTHEHSEISVHELRVINVFRQCPDKWLTHKEVNAAVVGVAARTVRHHTKRLVDLGMLDVTEAFPLHLYRWSERASSRNKAYLQRIDAVAAAVGPI